MLTIVLADSERGSRELNVEGMRAVIGKDIGCEVTLGGWRVSRRHAEVFVSNDRMFVRDLDSTFGTLVNDAKLEQARSISDEDEVRIGQHAFRVRYVKSDDDGMTTMAQPLDEQPAKSRPSAHSPLDALASLRPFSKKPKVEKTETAQVVPLPTAAPTPAANAKQEDEARFLRYRRIVHENLLTAFDVRRTDTHRMADDELRQLTERLVRELIDKIPDLPANSTRKSWSRRCSTRRSASARSSASGRPDASPRSWSTATTSLRRARRQARALAGGLHRRRGACGASSSASSRRSAAASTSPRRWSTRA